MKYISAHRRENGKPNPNGSLMCYGSIASFNRWTHQPHEHKREVARRLRQRNTKESYNGRTITEELLA